MPLNTASAIVHAFLPTLEGTGFGIRINADFSTDPSRTRIIFDEETLACIDDAAQAIAEKVSEATLCPEGNHGILACLTPSADLATLTLQKKSFRTELIALVKKKLDHLKDKITLAPSWLNATDALNIAGSLNRTVLMPVENNKDAQINFMRYLGVKILSTENAIKAIEKQAISAKGSTDLLIQCMRNVTGVNVRQLIDKPLWLGNGTTNPSTLSELILANSLIDNHVIENINASGISTNDFCRILKAAGVEPKELSILLPAEEIPADNEIKPAIEVQVPIVSKENHQGHSYDLFALLPCAELQTSPIITSRSLPAWRGAEQYVGMLLNDHGYNVEDCSRQNLGYDILAQKDGRKYYIEVKLIDYAGQPFIITTNEEAVAREHGNSYVIALTLRNSTNGVHIQFISNPTQALKFVRQCRQWVWECSEYEFDQSIKSTHL